MSEMGITLLLRYGFEFTSPVMDQLLSESFVNAVKEYREINTDKYWYKEAMMHGEVIHEVEASTDPQDKVIGHLRDNNNINIGSVYLYGWRRTKIQTKVIFSGEGSNLTNELKTHFQIAFRYAVHEAIKPENLYKNPDAYEALHELTGFIEKTIKDAPMNEFLLVRVKNQENIPYGNIKVEGYI